MATLAKQEVMMGHLRDCLNHFSQPLKGLKGTREATSRRRPMAEFCGVHDVTVASWMRDEEILPAGEKYIKLVCFLSLMGYRVLEFEDIPKLFRSLMELIGFGVITAKEAVKLLDYSEDGGENQIYRLVRGHVRNISERRKEAILNLWRDKRGELEKKKTEAEEKYYFDFASQQPSTAPTILSVGNLPSPSGETEIETSQLVLESSPVINIMAGLLGLLESNSKGITDNVSPSDARVILKLSGRLSQLSSQIISCNQEREG